METPTPRTNHTAHSLKSLREVGITHVWLTGVIQQATRTDYSANGQPADDADTCKGQAGSPYAIKDYFDVWPDYAIEPAKRLDEFRELVKRCHAHGLKVILDFVPNHVSRAYRSDIRPELSFGEGNDRGHFFSTKNHFYYLRLGAPPDLGLLAKFRRRWLPLRHGAHDSDALLALHLAKSP